jgi:ADP-ribose pyrophosphatase YjhB (NUDIX family)
MQCVALHQPELTSKAALELNLAGPDRDHLNFFLSHGFTMHHIKAEDTLALRLSLKPGPCKLPPGPTGYIGVGVLVINDENKVLAVRENYVDRHSLWKLPTGLFDPDKDEKWSDAAVRECYEETGIRCEFQFVTVERLMFGFLMYHLTDFFVICRCRPLTTEIRRDDVEITECRWIDMNELLDEGYDFSRPLNSISCQLRNGVKELVVGDYVVYHQEADGQ